MRKIVTVSSGFFNHHLSTRYMRYLLAAGVFCLVVFGAQPVAAATFAVDSTTDSIDAVPGDTACADAGGNCTLRAAIMEANALAGADEITLSAGVYTISIAGPNEDACVTGDFDISDTSGRLTITGAGADVTIIDAADLDRVMDVRDDADLKITGVTLQNGRCTGTSYGAIGGGLYNRFATAELEDCVVTSNYCYPNNGGGIYNGYGTLTLTRVTVSDNFAWWPGGIMSIGGYGIAATTTITDSSIIDNASQDGPAGALRISGNSSVAGESVVTIINSTISGNTTTVPAGRSITVHFGGTLNLNNVTITDNDGPAVWVQSPNPPSQPVGGTVNVKNSVIAGNTSLGDCDGTLTSQGHNLIQDTTTSSCTIVGDTTGNIIGSAPLLGPLADNGGPTLTHLPLEFSPAIDTANPAVPGSGGNACDAADQRGVSRPQDGDGDFTALCDMGAVEIEPPPLYPDLALTKDDFLVAVAPGDTIAYSLSFTNTGNGDAFGVVITDSVPDATTFNAGASTAGWVCVPDITAGSDCTLDLGTVAVVAADTATFAVTVDNPVASGVTQIANTASIADDGTGGIDPTPGDNSDSDTTTVSATPDFAIDKDDGGVDPAPGDTVVYTLSFANNGNQGADGVVLSDTVPANTVFDPVMSTPDWSCTPDNQAGSDCTFAAGSLAGGGAGGAADFTVIIDNPPPPGVSHISNTASITDDWLNGSDLNPADNTDTVVTLFETTPPTVDNVDTDAGTGDGTLDDCETAHGIQVVRLIVTFSEPVKDPPGDTDPDDVTNPANYQIVGAGSDLELDTFMCGPALGDDVEATITGVTYSAATDTATIQLDAGLEPSVHRLLVCGSTSIVDLAGNPLDGDGNGTGGDDFALTFRADPINLFTNGHLDCGLGGWTISETIPFAVTTSTVDADDSTLSGSAAISIGSATGSAESFSVGQCASVGEDRPHVMRLKVRLDADPGVTLTLFTECEFFDAAACSGASLGMTPRDTTLQDTGGGWQAVQDPAVAPIGAVSAFCRSILETAAGEVFDTWLDNLMLVDTAVVFADGFESGNTSAWSDHQP